MRARWKVLALAWGMLSAAATVSPTDASAQGAAADPEGGRTLQLALTFDDLPWVGPLPAGDTTANAAIDRIAAVLRVHQAPATGFVVSDRALEDEAPLRTWVAWGNALGNHSAAHRDLNSTAVDAWLADVRRCDEYLERFGEARTPFFRFPLLHQGDTHARRDTVQHALTEMGLHNAHVSVDTSDWILTRAHAQAVAAGDAKLQHEIGRDFVRHVVAALEHADDVARRKVGRPVPQVLLLHANALVDDHLDALLLALQARGVEFVSLRQALDDPVYARADGYVGRKGLSWLYRMELATPEDVAFDDAEAAAIEERFAAALAGETDPAAPPYLALACPPDFEEVLAAAARSERMRSLVVLHRGERVVEAYFHGAGPETPANLKSITKSLSSALVGVGLKQGWIASVDDPVGRYLPDLADSHPQAASVTLAELLTMSSGLRPVDYGDIQQSADWVADIASQPLDDQARGSFRYDTPVLQLLSAVLREASGRSLRALAEDELFGPLGGSTSHWRVDAQGLELGGNDAYLRPRDLARLGELYRNRGRVGGRSLLPADWVRASTSVQIRPESDRINHDTLRVRGYGYLWWLVDVGGEPAFAALGHGGQILMVFPGRELVVVMTSRWPSSSSAAHYEHLTRVLEEGVLPRFDRAG